MLKIKFETAFFALIFLSVLCGFSCAREVGSDSGNSIETLPLRHREMQPENQVFQLYQAPAKQPFNTKVTSQIAGEYLRRIAPMVLSRQISPQELPAAGADVDLQEWLLTATREAGFGQSIRFLYENKLRLSGFRDEIDFGIAGRLVDATVRKQMPLSRILTSEVCFDEAGKETACDSNAPYKAGILTTRGFLSTTVSRYNLHRANTTLQVFACQSFPMAHDLQPPLPKSSLIPLFRAETVEEQAAAAAKAGFANGVACYSCHSQFSAHAQMFVKFDKLGIWHADANGDQDPNGEAGYSRLKGLMTSHMVDPTESASESTQIFGKFVSNLKDAANVFARSPQFASCAQRNIVEHVLALSSDQLRGFPRAILDDGLKMLLARNISTHEATAQDFAAAILSHPAVVGAVLSNKR